MKIVHNTYRGEIMTLSDLKLPEKYLNDIQKAVDILKKEGCTEIFIFGSLVKLVYDGRSDIDIAVKGLPANRYFKVVGKLELELDTSIDVVDLDEEENNFVKLLKEKGELVRVA